MIIRAGASVLSSLALTTLLSCSSGNEDKKAAPAESNVGLGGEIGAKVGDQAIPLSIIKSIANSQKISAGDAAHRVIDDEIAAQGALSRGLEKQQPVAWRLVAARGKMTADVVMHEAKQAGLPTDAEVNVLTQRHWLEVDRPPAVRVMHAVAMTKDPTKSEAAKALSAEIRKAVLNATTAEEFEQKAKAVPHEKALDIHVDSVMPAFVIDGRVTEGGGGAMDAAFAKGAFAIANIGETSPPVQSSFGWHVIRLLERLPEHRVPLEARRTIFSEEALALRARNLLEMRLAPLRASHPVTISPAAEQLMVTAMSTIVAVAPTAGGTGNATP